jgi:hypothetical protein
MKFQQESKSQGFAVIIGKVRMIGFLLHVYAYV